MREVAITLFALASVGSRRRSLQWLLAGCGSVALIASVWTESFENRDMTWAVSAATVVAVAVWLAAPMVQRVLPTRGGAWWLLLGCVVAVYGCVPETDQMYFVAFVVLSGGVIALATQGRMPVLALAGAGTLVEWSALFGASGSPRAVVGGLFALTPVCSTGAIAWLARDQRKAWLLPAIAVAWLAAAVAMVRTGGVNPSMTIAVESAALWFALAITVSAVLWRVARRKPSAA